MTNTENINTENINTENTNATATTSVPETPEVVLTDNDYQAAAMALLNGEDVPNQEKVKSPTESGTEAGNDTNETPSPSTSASLEALMEKQSQLEKQLEEYKTGNDKYLALSKAIEEKDPDGIFDNLGMDYDKLTDLILSTDDPENQYSKLKDDVASQLEQQKTELEKIKENLALKEQQVQKNQYFNVLDKTVNDLEDKSRWGLTLSNDNWKEDVLEYASLVFNETKKTITPEEALDALEKTMEENVTGVLSKGDKAKKLLLEKLGLSNVNPSKLTSNSLSNSYDNAPPNKVDDENMTDQDYINRALLIANNM